MSLFKIQTPLVECFCRCY